VVGASVVVVGASVVVVEASVVGASVVVVRPVTPDALLRRLGSP
jgi:hypothetical protein